MSLHQQGLLEAASLARLRGLDPQTITIIGVEPFSLGPGLELSETLARKLPDLCHLLLEEVRSSFGPPL